MAPDITGLPPTEEDRFWLNAVSQDTPDKSLERVDAFGKYLFTSVATVGSLLTGFGIFKPETGALLKNPLFLIPVALACLSLSLAMMGITPRPGEVDRQDPESIRDYYNRLIRRRGRFVFWAGVTFALSLASAAGAIFLAAGPPAIHPSISVKLEKTDKGDRLTARIDYPQLAPSAIARTSITAVPKPVPKQPRGPASAVLFFESSRPDQSGKVTISAALEQLRNYERFLVSAEVLDQGRVVDREVVVVPR